MKFPGGDPPISSWSGALLGELRETVLSSLFPPRCPICDRVLSPGERICPSCVPCIRPMRRPLCLKCGRGIASEEAELCENCRKRRFSFDFGFILLEYSDEISESIARIKYHGRREYLSFYGELSAGLIGERLLSLSLDALVPVPLHRERLRRRGYNQAELLAERIGELLKLPVYPAALHRVRNTKALKNLNPEERARDMQRAIRPGRIPESLRSVCLVDDIFTTGATVEACSSALREAGVAKIYSLCLAGRAER